MKILVALGGEAAPCGNPAAEAERREVERTARALASIAAEHQVAIAHGNGLEAEYALDLALRNALPDRDVVTVFTQVVVGAEAPAFGEPANPLPSLEPRAIVELRSLRRLIEGGALPICAGNGVPVAIDEDASMYRIEATVNTDFTAALLARRLDADLFVLLTDVDAVHLDRGGAGERPIHSTHPEELRGHDFAAGSIGPKVEAACRFVEATGRRAAIGARKDAVRIVRGSAGTQVAPRFDEQAIATVDPLRRG